MRLVRYARLVFVEDFGHLQFAVRPRPLYAALDRGVNWIWRRCDPPFASDVEDDGDEQPQHRDAGEQTFHDRAHCITAALVRHTR